MSTLSKLSLDANEIPIDKKENFGLKPWQIALLLGIPSAALIAYLVYRNNHSANKKTVPDKIEDSKNFSKEETKSKTLEELTTTQSNKNPLDRAVEIKNLGNEFFQKGKFDDAVKCYSEAINLCPKKDKEELPKFYQNRAAAYENLKMFEQVIEDCSEALKVDPNYSKALTRRAKAYESLENYNEAFEDYTALCILQKFSSSSMAAADKIVKKIGEKMGKDIFKNRDCIPISQHFVNNFYIGLNNDVIIKNEQFLENVKLKESTFINALNEFTNGDFEKCIEFCSVEVNENTEFFLEARNLRGSLYMLRCQYNKAVEDFEFILNNDQASERLKSNTFIKLTALNLQNGEEEKAFENYEKAIEIDPTNEDIYCNRAQVFAMKGRFDECFKDFDKCIQLNSNHKVAKLQKAFFAFRQFYAQLSMYAQATNSASLLNESKELKEETAKLETLLEEYSEVPEAYNLFAQILSEQENYEKAERYYKIALDNDPKNAALLVQRALNIMTWKNDFAEPIIMLNQAINIDDTCEFAYETLATIEIQRGNLPRAVELFEKAIQLTRSEDSLINLCCMLVGAKTQFKILQQYSNTASLAI